MILNTIVVQVLVVIVPGIHLLAILIVIVV